MASLFFWMWIVGGFPAVILAEIMRAERPWIVRAARIAFALLLAVDLLFAAVVLAVGSSNGDYRFNATRGIWWLTIIAGGIPLALVSGLAVRRGYTGRRLVLAIAVLTTAALYVTFPFAFIPAHQPLTGLGRFEHEHHGVSIAILLIPTLILLVNELSWRQEGEPSYG